MNEKEYSLDDVYLSLTDNNLSENKADDKMMSKAVIDEGFISRKKLPFEMHNGSKYRKKQVIRRKMSAETRKDIEVIRMRSALDPKRFYKRNLNKVPMKNVQVGTVIDSPADFYHSRLPNKSRKNTLVDELMADAKFKKSIKKRYLQIIEKKKFKYKKEYKIHKRIKENRKKH